MTLQERRQPDLLNASRRRRIAAGSGTTVQDVNQLVKQFREMQKMMKQLGIMGKGKKNKRRKGHPSSGQRGNFLPSALSDLLGGR
jgi:signal recognition particle subunit SRP54